MPLSLHKRRTISLFPTEEWLLPLSCTILSGMTFQVPGSLLYVIYIILTCCKATCYWFKVSSFYQQSEVHQASMKNLHCFVCIHLKLQREVRFRLYTGLVLMFPSQLASYSSLDDTVLIAEWT